MSNSRLKTLKKFEKEIDILKLFLDWNYEIAPDGVRYFLQQKINLLEEAILILKLMIEGCNKNINKDSDLGIENMNIIQFILFQNPAQVFTKNDFPIISRIDEWTKYLSLIHISEPTRPY